MSTARRMTDDQLAAAADALLPAVAPFPPMALEDVLDAMTSQTRDLQADLWTLRDAIDNAKLSTAHQAVALIALADLAALYDDATDTLRRLAIGLGLPVADIHYGPSSC